MTNPDLLALANELDDIETDAGGKCNWSEVATVSDALRRLASSEDGVKGKPEPEPEPVAWRYRYRDNAELHAWSYKDRQSVGDWQVEPLYTAPPADAGMREACLRILPYLRWTISDESPGHHPTMPSAVAEFEAALTAPGATTKSDGASRPCTCHPDDKPPEPCPQKFAYTECVEATKPSDPSSTRSEVTASLQGEDAVERVARIIDPDAMRLYDECRGSGRVAANGKLLADVAYSEGRNGALTKARAILATGLVPDEAAVRGDEREKCAKAAESVYADPNYHMFFRQAGDVIAAAIRSNRREA